MSYKFQRLREQLRDAVSSGELAGKLPGERMLARRFNVNAKTLSKALTDLAAEGVLDRSIGRGTYVKGAAPSSAAEGRWLVLCDDSNSKDCLIEQLRCENPSLQTADDLTALRPSFLNQFQVVIDAAQHTPEALLRDLVVRGLPVIAIGHEPRTYSMHSVLADSILGASRLCRDLVLAGHRRLAVIEQRHSSATAQVVRATAARYANDVSIEPAGVEDIDTLLQEGVSAIVCDGIAAAQAANQALQERCVLMPSGVSLAAVGHADKDCPCSGYYVDSRQIARAVAELLRDLPARPATLWLAGEFVDRGTIGIASTPLDAGHHANAVYRPEFSPVMA